MHFEFDDGETMDPRQARATAQRREPTLRLVFDGGDLQIKNQLFRLRPGETHLGRAVGRPTDIAVPLDRRASRLHATLLVGPGPRVRIRNESKFGTEVSGEAVEEAELDDGDWIRCGDSFFVYRALPPMPENEVGRNRLLGEAPAIRQLRSTIATVGFSEATVLLLGESGAGKEVVAGLIHEVSGRKGPFIAINCGAIPDTLAESQLFGHRAGAFTGANRDHNGFFREAQGGTLFLDEIGELPLALQPKLLRALEQREVLPVGMTRPVPVDVRVVAATNRDLIEAVQEGRFRGDLYSRVAELVVDLPPLRDRREDVLLLMSQALDEDCPPLAPDLVARLLGYHWPFNVREALKVGTELSVRGKGQEFLEAHLIEDRLIPDGPRFVDVPRTSESYRTTTSELSGPAPVAIPGRDELEALLRTHRGVIADVARVTGRSRKQVYRWLERHGLDADSYRDPEV